MPHACWRYSFREQLKKAKATGGCMVQLVEGTLGAGQEIETRMAQILEVEICRLSAVPGFLPNTYFFRGENCKQVESRLAGDGLRRADC